MNNYRLQIQYNGTRYSGWQIQPKVPTIQREITEVLSTITGEEINLIGSGRTDAGVHALGQVANFKTESQLNIRKTKHSLNSIISKDISISEMELVNPDFHSRFDAKLRSYLYLFIKNKSPFFTEFSYQYSPLFDLDLEKINLISSAIIGEHNFKSFSKKNTDTENMVCNISLVNWKRSKDKIFFRVDGNRFLHGMVRTLVGTIIGIAEQGESSDKMNEIIAAEDRGAAGRSFPAKGLFLKRVKY